MPLDTDFPPLFLNVNIVYSPFLNKTIFLQLTIIVILLAITMPFSTY
jgi:hypothetical protein